MCRPMNIFHDSCSTLISATKKTRSPDDYQSGESGSGWAAEVSVHYSSGASRRITLIFCLSRCVDLISNWLTSILMDCRQMWTHYDVNWPAIDSMHYDKWPLPRCFKAGLWFIYWLTSAYNMIVALSCSVLAYAKNVCYFWLTSRCEQQCAKLLDWKQHTSHSLLLALLMAYLKGPRLQPQLIHTNHSSSNLDVFILFPSLSGLGFCRNLEPASTVYQLEEASCYLAACMCVKKMNITDILHV